MFGQERRSRKHHSTFYRAVQAGGLSEFSEFSKQASSARNNSPWSDRVGLNCWFELLVELVELVQSSGWM